MLSDSGTVQEECCIFGVPTVTMRDVTERPETIECGSNILAGVEAERILPAIDVAVRSKGTWTPPAEYLAEQRLRHRRSHRAGHRVSGHAHPGRGRVRACSATRRSACSRPTSRSGARAATPSALPDLGVPAERMLGGLDATDAESRLRASSSSVQPDFVLNAVGIVKQRADAKAAIPSIEVNSLWPHVLADACARARRADGAREHGLRVLGLARHVPRGRRARRVRPVRALEAAGRGHRSRERRDAAHLDHRLADRRADRARGLVRGAPRRAAQGLHEGGVQRAHDPGAHRGHPRRRDARSEPHGLWHVSAEPIDKYSLLTRSPKTSAGMSTSRRSTSP